MGHAWLFWSFAVLGVTFGRGGRRWSPEQRHLLNEALTAVTTPPRFAGSATVLAGLAMVSVTSALGRASAGALLRIAPSLLVTLGGTLPAMAFSRLQRRARMLPSPGA